MEIPVQIEQFESTDQDALLSFLRRAYPDDSRKSDPSFWRWHFLENPYTRRDHVPLWVVRSGKQIVGQLATIPVELKVGEENTRAIWILDFIVDPHYRGRGLGKQLVLAAREFCPTMLTLGINEQSTAVFRSLEWVSLRSIHRYHRLLFPGNALLELSSWGPARQLINICYAPFRPRLGRQPSKEDRLPREVAGFDAAFDGLWQRANSQWLCAVVRSSKYLEWQFKRQPGKRYHILGLYEKDYMVGYVVLFFRKGGRGRTSPKAAIADLCYDASRSAEVIDELLKAALRLALERRAGSIVTDILDPRVEDRLRHFGFRQVKASPQFMISAANHQHLIYELSNWFLTRGDSDISIFEHPNL